MHSKTLPFKSLASFPESSHTAHIHAGDGLSANSTLCHQSSIPSSIYPPTRLSSHLAIHLPAITYQSICPAICPLIYVGIYYPSIHPHSVHLPIQPLVYLSFYPSIHLSIQLAILYLPLIQPSSINPPINVCIHSFTLLSIHSSLHLTS